MPQIALAGSFYSAACPDSQRGDCTNPRNTGHSKSTNFPIAKQYQTDPDGAAWDAIVTKLSPTGNSLIYSTYLGGGDDDQGVDIVGDGHGNAYVVGSTRAYDFPTQNPYQGFFNEVRDAIITKLAFSPTWGTGTTGNVNTTGTIDISDLSLLVNLVIVPPPALPCLQLANVNAMGIIDLSDLSLLVNYLTIQPPPILPNCP